MRIVARVAAAALAMAAVAGPAMARDPMAGAYGNTVVVTYPGDAKAMLYIEADGTYTGTGPDGTAVAGTWTIDGGQTCFTQSSPQPGPPSCNKTVSKKAGDTWTATGADGTKVTVTIVEGR